LNANYDNKMHIPVHEILMKSRVMKVNGTKFKIW